MAARAVAASASGAFPRGRGQAEMATGDAAATRSAARVTRIYAYASVLTVVFGFAVMSAESPYTHKTVASFGETWIWLSLVLWLIAAGLALAITAPSLSSATHRITDGSPVTNLTPRVAASGGIIAILLAIVVFLMVYRPGS